MKHKIIYNDFAPLAAENATVPAAGSSAFQSSGDLLNTDSRNIPNYATFENSGIDLLDFDLCFASEGENIGYISSALSSNSRLFSPAVCIVTELADGYYSAPGITFRFWQNYCSEVQCSWYKDSALLDTVTFYPDSLEFYGEHKVENFNKIIISFLRSEVPYQFVKLAGIDLGRTFEITKFHGPINVFREISDDCSDLPGSTCEFEAQTSQEFMPQDKQVFFLYSDDEFMGKFTVDNVTPDGGGKFAFECSDDVMGLDGAPFPALEHGTHKMSDILSAVKAASNVEIDSGEFFDTELTGFIETQKKTRTAVVMAAFAVGAFISSDSKKLRLCRFRNTDIRINSGRIIGRAAYKQNSPYTAISLKTYGTSFNNVISEKTIINPMKKASKSVGVKSYDKYSLTANADERMNQLGESGFYRNEITANIILNGEKVGDIVAVETPHNGFRTGVIKSMDITLAAAKTAKITVIERNFTEYGGND